MDIFKARQQVAPLCCVANLERSKKLAVYSKPLRVVNSRHLCNDGLHQEPGCHKLKASSWRSAAARLSVSQGAGCSSLGVARVTGARDVGDLAFAAMDHLTPAETWGVCVGRRVAMHIFNWICNFAI